MSKYGYSPRVDKRDEYKSKRVYELHHVIPISDKGGVYDMNNIVVLTPRIHNSTHYGEKP